MGLNFYRTNERKDIMTSWFLCPLSVEIDRIIFIYIVDDYMT